MGKFARQYADSAHLGLRSPNSLSPVVAVCGLRAVPSPLHTTPQITMAQAGMSSADLAKALCDLLVATGKLKASPGFIREDREAKLVGIFECVFHPKRYSPAARQPLPARRPTRALNRAAPSLREPDSATAPLLSRPLSYTATSPLLSSVLPSSLPPPRSGRIAAAASRCRRAPSRAVVLPAVRRGPRLIAAATPFPSQELRAGRGQDAVLRQPS